MKAFRAHAMIGIFHRRSLLVFPVAGLLLAALAAWFLVGGSEAQAAFNIDHFKCYDVQNAQPHTDFVTLTDQFGTTQNNLNGPARKFCNPVEKTHNMVVTPITNPDSHLMFYPIIGPAEPTRIVDVDNQFGQQQLILNDAVFLLVPTQKQPFAPPHDLDHFKCYQTSGVTAGVTVDLRDQFHSEAGVQMANPEFFCNPVQKVHNAQTFPITNPTDHLLCYRISAPTFATGVQTNNQIGPEALSVIFPSDLCVPTLKLAVNTPTPTPPPPVVLDHFKCYEIQNAQPHTDLVILRDQFGETQNNINGPAQKLCNPVQKTHNQVVTPITNPDSHLIAHPIIGPTEPGRDVDVNNQFGQQHVVVKNAVFLLVPTQKQPGGPPHDLDHFKCYAVVSGQLPTQQVVDLLDQFHNEPQVQVVNPDFFCNPVEKTHNAQVFPITHPDDHLLCYRISAQPFSTSVQTNNQIGPENLSVVFPSDLCVPTQKLGFCVDTDADDICDPVDNCPLWGNPSQAYPLVGIHPTAGDADCDGFPDPVAVPGRATETYITTNPLIMCAETAGINNDPLPDTNPMDFNDDRIFNGADTGTFGGPGGGFNKPVAGGPYNGRPGVRYDFNGDGIINGADTGKYGGPSGYFNKVCVPAGP